MKSLRFSQREMLLIALVLLAGALFRAEKYLEARRELALSPDVTWPKVIRVMSGFEEITGLA
jgi:hypothetical protein